VLEVTDRADPSPRLLDAVAARAASGDVQFRLVLVNPARAEIHLLHPERHDKAFEAERVLLETLPLVEAAAGGRVIGTVSVRHDPVDAIEETILSEPIDEIMLALPRPGSTGWMHQLHPDLTHRLQRFHLPVTDVSRPR